MESLTPEEILEKLKEAFPTIRFKAGTVGFGVFQGHKSMVFPYTVFNQPDFADMFARAITILELMPSPCGHDHAAADDDWDIGDLLKDG